MSKLTDAIQEYRKRLLDHERTAQAALDYAHKQTVALIDAQLDALFTAMTNYMQAGEPVPLEWLYENRRLQVLEQYITQAIDHFGALTQMQVAQLQHMGVQLGTQAGMALLQSVVPQGVTFAFGIPDQKAITNLIGATQAGSPLADLFNGFGKEAAQAAKDALISGVTLGYGPRQIAPSIQDALNISRNRALTIARTESLRSYRGANLETFKANSDVVDQWRWTCALSTRTCAACIAMDGTLHDLSESMDSHPCCRCTMTPVTKSWDDILGPLGIDTTGIEDTNPALDMQTGQEWFNNLDADQQRQILGNAKYDAFADGKFQLSDVVGINHDADWGNSIYERSLKDILEAAGSTPAPVEEAPKEQTPEERLQALEDAMNAKYPDTLFNFTNTNPDIMEGVVKQLDKLMSQYPEVAKTIPYIGTGKNADSVLPTYFKGYKKWMSGAVAKVEYANNAKEAFTPIYLRPSYFKDAEKFAEFQLTAEEGWLAKGSGSIEYMVTHEFGHVLDNYLEIEGRGQSIFDFIGSQSIGEVSTAVQYFMEINRTLGNKVGTYALVGGPKEQFAEAFASMNFAPQDEWAAYTQKLYDFLNAIYPDNSSDNWTAVDKSKPTKAQVDQWNKFRDTYIS